jgi:hypothetical protein
MSVYVSYRYATNIHWIDNFRFDYSFCRIAQTLTAAAAQQAAADAIAAAVASCSNDDAALVIDAAAFDTIISSSDDTAAAAVAAAADHTEECDKSVSAPTTDQHQGKQHAVLLIDILIHSHK